MALQHYPEINDLDDLFGFSAAQKRAETGEIVVQEEPDFIPHRIFLNHVDKFNARHISSYITDQKYAPAKKDVGGGEGEGEGEAEEKIDMAEELANTPKIDDKSKFEVIGTLNKSFHAKTEDILFTLNEDDEDFMKNIMKCGFVIYDITNDPGEIPKALATLTVMESEIEELKKLGPKTFKNIEEVRVFILISTTMTWALTKPLDPDDPELPFAETDYRKRKPHPNYRQHIDCEKEVIAIGRTNKEKLQTYVIASGMIYGMEEDDLTCLFKLAWYNEKEMPLFSPGKNMVPLIHINDLAKVLHKLMEKLPSQHYIFAVEQTPATLRHIIQALSKTMATGRTKDVVAEEAFLYQEMTQTLYERCTVNLNMEPGCIVEDFEIEWQNEANLAENMQSIVNEFKKCRGLTPTQIIVHGPPAVGKTRLAKQLCDYYNLHYIHVKGVIDHTLQEWRERIERQKLKTLAKEQQQQENALETGEGQDENEEAEEEEDEEVDDIEELEEQIREIESAMAESENGKLPDEHVIRLMKAFLKNNSCQNQGYIIDGYPKTMSQTKQLFGGGEEEGGEEELGEEDEGESGSGKNKLLPDYVISLEATNEFLCKRIMALTEKELEGTRYMEGPMLMRLEEFRVNNTEDNTMLNFFDELEIHPIVLNAMEDTTENMDSIVETIKKRLGQPIGFGLTGDEEEELIKLAIEKQKLLVQEAKMMKEIMERDAVADYQSKMEQWSQLLEHLQMEEEKILAAQSEPLRQYMIKYVFPTLCKGLLEVARLKPDDPVDYLAEYLFKQNPEGHMFDPAYSREGKRLMAGFKESAEVEILKRTVQDKFFKCQ